MNFIKTKWIWVGFSGILIILSILAILFYKIPLGIDFAGGTDFEFKIESDIQKIAVEEKLKEAEVKNINLRILEQGSGGVTFSLKSEEIPPEKVKVISEKLGELGKFSEIKRETVGPAVSKDLTRKAVIAIILASIMIIIYIAWSFRSVPKPASSWNFGTTAVIALLHDLIIASGAMAIYGHFYGFEIDSLFITAMLTIMGFSVHDTIVVFDRFRENLRHSPSLSFSENVNNAIIQTITRSLNTSLTVIITLLALTIFGGESTYKFTLTLIIGIFIGTYSSIFVATTLLVLFDDYKKNKITKNKKLIEA